LISQWSQADLKVLDWSATSPFKHEGRCVLTTPPAGAVNIWRPAPTLLTEIDKPRGVVLTESLAEK
jgi:hypothetical protein